MIIHQQHQLLPTRQQLKRLLPFCKALLKILSSVGSNFSVNWRDGEESMLFLKHDEELMQFLQSKSRWLPASVIVQHILPLLDRVSQNRLCELLANGGDGGIVCIGIGLMAGVLT